MIARRGFFVLAFLAAATAAEARSGVIISGEGCGSPLLSQAVGARQTLAPTPKGEWCVSFVNDVGVVESVTFHTDADLDDLVVLPDSRLPKMRVNKRRREVTLFGGRLPSRDVAIVFRGLDRPASVTLKRYRSRRPKP